MTCPNCGGETERYWTTSPTVIPDTYTTPLVDQVTLKQDHVWHSRSEQKAAMQAHNLVPMVRHVGEQGSDKSRHTTSWMSGPPAGHDPRPMCQLSEDEQAARRVEWANS